MDIKFSSDEIVYKKNKNTQHNLIKANRRNNIQQQSNIEEES